MVMDAAPLVLKYSFRNAEGIAGVQNILHDDQMAAGDILLQIMGDLHPPGRRWWRFDRNFGFEFTPAGPAPVCHKDE